MATTSENEVTVSRNRPGVKGRKKMSPRTDMTPMVDLAFLLISFFIMTTEMTKPKKFDIAVPKDGPPMGAKSSASITVLAGEEKQLYWYAGEMKDAIEGNSFNATDYSANGLRKIIQQKQKELGTSREELMVLIKPLNAASYNSVVKLLDEMFISDVKRYALTDADTKEVDFIRQHP